MVAGCNIETNKRIETCCQSTVRRVAAMLDLDSHELIVGAPLPMGWHFVLMGADTRRSELRDDGFPGLGVSLPDFGLPRLLLAGRTVAFCSDIPIGETVHRTSALTSISHKTTASGPMTVVTLEYQLRIASTTHLTATQQLAIVETQTYFLLSSHGESNDLETPSRTVTGDKLKSLVPDETLLFQYSALGFNSHRIHLDRVYSRGKGYPDLVVNGGLTMLLLTEFMRQDLGVVPLRIKVKYVAPLFCGRPITLTADKNGNNWHLRAFNDRGFVAAEMEVVVK